MTPTVILASIAGLIYGSFLNALLWRLPQGKGMGGRSECRSCNHTLAWYDLIPVASFLALRGKCRYCKTSVSAQYPLVEIAAAFVLGLFFYIQAPVLTPESALTIVGILMLMSLFFFDLLYFILPDVFVLPGIVLFGLYDLFLVPDPIPYFVTALLAGAFFAILYAVSAGKQLGFGDVKLAILIGLMLGYPLGFAGVVGGVWLAAIVSLFLLMLKKVSRTDAIPLGAFMSLVALVIIIFSRELLPYIPFF